MRALWKGHIQFSLVTIPVKIYGAIEASQKISFNQLHADDFGRVKYEKKCKKCGKVLRTDEIVKGYEIEPDTYVVVEKEDFEKLKMKSLRVIEIEGFVKEDEVHATLFDTPYFAGPDGPVAAKTYALLVETLKESGMLGVGRVVLRDRESVMLLAPNEQGLMLYKLRYPEELRAMDKVPEIDSAVADRDQLKLARTLVDTMATTLDKLELKDRYNDALREMIVAKAEGKELVTSEEAPKEVVDIMTALQASIDEAKENRKPMKKAGEEKAVEADEEPARKTG
ncbi:MAG: Ku protein [Rhodothermales bacterium]|nr:Ku protein [Rhodothermales bacterium]MBO6779204.1 Ku protein [Rhodothermales bacterium]